jgi:hypothetical protein
MSSLHPKSELAGGSEIAGTGQVSNARQILCRFFNRSGVQRIENGGMFDELARRWCVRKRCAATEQFSNSVDGRLSRWRCSCRLLRLPLDYQGMIWLHFLQFAGKVV